VTIARQVLVRPRPDWHSPRVYVRETTKSRRHRRVRFDERTAVALRRWKAEQAEERLAFGGAWKRDGGLDIEAPWIVTEPDGTVIHPDTLLARWGRLVEAVGVPRIPCSALATPTPWWPWGRASASTWCPASSATRT
jgi:integrase